MDMFGIGAAMKAMTRVYFQSARGSGRTTMMIDSLHEGDRVVFSNARERERVEKLIRDRGLKDVKCIVVPPREPTRAFERGTSQGRTIFDHSWVEQFYEDRIKDASGEIDWLQTELSGYGEAHRETARQAAELAKWQPPF
jgi:hypothetical protein